MNRAAWRRHVAFSRPRQYSYSGTLGYLSQIVDYLRTAPVLVDFPGIRKRKAQMPKEETEGGGRWVR